MRERYEPITTSARAAVTPFDDSLPTPTRNNWTSPQTRQSVRPSTDSVPPTHEAGVQTGNLLVQPQEHNPAPLTTLKAMSESPQGQQEVRTDDDQRMEERDDGDTETFQESSSLKRASADVRANDKDENPPKRSRADATDDDGSSDEE